MGKAKKEHRKKVAARNQRIKGQQNAMQKLFNESMRQQLEELRNKERQRCQVLQKQQYNEMGFIQSISNLQLFEYAN